MVINTGPPLIFDHHDHLKGPPNDDVGVQKSAVVSFATGNVLEIGTKQSPRLFKSCFGLSSWSFSLSVPCMYNTFDFN